ncbi:MAG: glycosyltransferase family 4 protein [Anaerocolumna sp.]|nr:glycosyltransferase family 4 protein [Anaerocolumna sp.]
MRIAMLTNNYKPFVGGVPISIERLADGLRNIGQEVYIFAPSYEDAEEEPFVIRYGSMKKKLNGELTIPKFAVSQLEKKFEDMNFDLIHVHHPVISGYIGCYIGWKYKIPVIFTHHTRYEQYLHYFKKFNSKKLVLFHNRIFTNCCSMVFAPTPGIKTFLQENGTVSEIEVLPTGLLTKDYTYNDCEVEALRKQYSPEGQRLFCTVSRLEKEKNISFLLDSLKVFKDRNGGQFRFLIIGEGTQKDSLRDRVVELGLVEQVVFLGSIPNHKITSYYNVCDLFLFASTTETQGIVVLEAMAAGLPVIAVNATGVRDVLINGVNGYMTEENIYEWADRLGAVCNNHDIYVTMKVEAKAQALKYNEADIAKTALRYYQHAVTLKEMERSYEKKTI